MDTVLVFVRFKVEKDVFGLLVILFGLQNFHETLVLLPTTPLIANFTKALATLMLICKLSVAYIHKTFAVIADKELSAE